MGSLTLRYKRVGYEYEGDVVHSTEPDEPILNFSMHTFEEMVMSFSVLLISDEMKAYFLRTERPDLKPIEIEGDDYQQLRHDPKGFAAARTVEPQVVYVREKVTPTDQVKVTVRAGYDTLADAFGDEVYFRCRDGKYESPITGRWEVPGNIGVWTVGVSDTWGKAPVVELLNERKSRYFLPRAWNESGSWISHDELKKKYDEYLKEKSNAERQ